MNRKSLCKGNIEVKKSVQDRLRQIVDFGWEWDSLTK